MEEWRVIDGFERYEVSNTGFVRNINTGRILKAGTAKHGYFHVNLWKNNKHYTKTVHRLVALAFCNGYKEGLVVDHIDSNKQNNRAVNLRFCSQSQNIANSKKQKNCTSRFKGVSFYKPYQCWSVEIRFNSDKYFVGYYQSEEQASQAYNVVALHLFKAFSKLNPILPEQYTPELKNKMVKVWNRHGW